MLLTLSEEKNVHSLVSVHIVDDEKYQKGFSVKNDTSYWPGETVIHSQKETSVRFSLVYIWEKTPSLVLFPSDTNSVKLLQTT